MKHDCFVFEAYPLIRKMFIRRVYQILLCQLVLTAAVVWGFQSYAQSHMESTGQPPVLTWLMLLGVVGSLGSLFALHLFAKDFPKNLVILGLFTLCESLVLGVVLMRFPTDLLLEALVITTTVFIGLVLYTLESKTDYSFLGSFLFSALWVLIFGFFLQWIFPFPSWIDAAWSWAGALIFCGFVIFDTWRLHFKLKPDEYIVAVVSLYLDFINLFIRVLHILASRKK